MFQRFALFVFRFGSTLHEEPQMEPQLKLDCHIESKEIKFLQARHTAWQHTTCHTAWQHTISSRTKSSSCLQSRFAVAKHTTLESNIDLLWHSTAVTPLLRSLSSHVHTYARVGFVSGGRRR